MKTEKTFKNLIIISLILYIFLLLFIVMLKTIMPNDLIPNYNFLSTMTLEERMIRGFKILEFYKIEYELGIIGRTIILDILNIIIFIPFGILLTHCFKTKRVLKTVLVSLVFSTIIEMFQLISIIGSFMLNDLIINVIGGLIGSIIYIVVTKGKKYTVYNILLIIFILVSSLIITNSLISLISNIDLYIDIITRKI